MAYLVTSAIRRRYVVKRWGKVDVNVYAWNIRFEVILPLVVLGAVFIRGWLRLRARGSQGYASSWRLIAFLAGILVTIVALVSPLDRLGYYLFFMSMIQHLVLLMVAPPLLLLANPIPFLLWGIPRAWRLRLGRLVAPGGRVREVLRPVTRPGLSWIIFVSTLLLWHDAFLYDAALRYPLLNDLQNFTFFMTSALLWWHILGAGPRFHRRLPWLGRVAYLVGTTPFNMLLGIALAFSTSPWYPYYTEVPRLWNIPPVRDQAIGGLIMWIPGSMMYLLFALIYIARYLQLEAEKPPLPESTWATHENMAAPG